MLELTIFELGQFLKKLEKNYGLDLMIKNELSGGWITINGKVKIEKIPALVLGGSSKGNNVIEIRLISEEANGSLIKLIGANGKRFKVNVEPTKYRVLGSNEIKLSDSECKVLIDENIIFSVKESAENVIKMIKR